MTTPFFGPSPTPTKYVYRYSKGGSPYYGDNTTGLYGLGAIPPRTSLFKILKESDHLQLYGKHGMSGLGNTTTDAATAAAVTTGIFTGAVIVGLGVSYALGRFVGAPIIEMTSGKKLTLSQKRGVGVATMIL
tara:strand:+ start:2441 stop:2836 length:396 start_codon:yes stop_codon:yes gene_type:complete